MSLAQNSQTAAGVRRRGRMRLGEDILLARHGSSIVSMRLDRRADCMVATLRDGSIDCASNRILATGPSPLARLGAQVQALREDRAEVSRSEVKTLLKFSAIWLAISVVFTVGVVCLAAFAPGGADAVGQSMMYPAF
ncbi:hypothetical protein GCM10012320_21000 [Sinomonas cellulolyticus]|uniref:Uncharacterized protein n=1 Tax=Sinomonas cellulolyticus TaxID=2801916 RepID=A0ABS1K256_9MICC|nr:MULTISPECIES: hypothetical protein [Sinomonas]MBL0705610.1 hypothetical protein [Sinomonas cellulolyticus]GHG51570.1 hypothetical protein GCM10012320_21000 [Sinomonas sp. KCTC 49339]